MYEVRDKIAMKNMMEALGGEGGEGSVREMVRYIQECLVYQGNVVSGNIVTTDHQKLPGKRVNIVFGGEGNK